MHSNYSFLTYTSVHNYLLQALCGGTVDVPTLDDRVITVPITEVIRFVPV